MPATVPVDLLRADDAGRVRGGRGRRGARHQALRLLDEALRDTDLN